jgi:hypothetical protein
VNAPPYVVIALRKEHCIDTSLRYAGAKVRAGVHSQWSELRAAWSLELALCPHGAGSSMKAWESMISKSTYH